MQEKHVETAKQLLGNGRLLNDFVSRLLDDIANLKAMLRAISIGASCCRNARRWLAYSEVWRVKPTRQNSFSTTATLQPQLATTRRHLLTC